MSAITDTLTHAMIMLEQRRELPAPQAPWWRFFRARPTPPRVGGTALFERNWTKKFSSSCSLIGRKEK